MGDHFIIQKNNQTTTQAMWIDDTEIETRSLESKKLVENTSQLIKYWNKTISETGNELYDFSFTYNRYPLPEKTISCLAYERTVHQTFPEYLNLTPRGKEVVEQWETEPRTKTFPYFISRSFECFTAQDPNPCDIQFTIGHFGPEKRLPEPLKSTHFIMIEESCPQ